MRAKHFCALDIMIQKQEHFRQKTLLDYPVVLIIMSIALTTLSVMLIPTGHGHIWYFMVKSIQDIRAYF